VNEALAQPLPEATTQTDADSFEALYERTFPRVYAYAASLLRDRAAAEDVTAQAFERAYRKRRGYRPTRGSAEAWLFGIARNAALDELRRRQRTAALVTEPAAVTPEPEEELEQTLRRAAVRTALAALPARDHELIALKFHAGLDNAEIADVLGVSVSNAGTQLHRAMTKLRRAVDDRS
jgi:RNA polymerase sigma-70 factor, ECF subfamily